jgi:lipoyl(octanoyl) transferase
MPPEALTHTVGEALWLGKGVDYLEAWEMQKRITAERAEGKTHDTLLLLEHAPVYTAGPRAPREHVIGPLTAPLVDTDRGGQITYHGPGQLVGYPIVGLTAKGLGPKAYVRVLEESLVEALGQLGVAAHTEDGMTGVWTAKGKIAAIGVRITRGVAMHGFALNVNTDLAAYEPIIPCGIDDRPVASMAAVLGAVPDADVVRRAVVASLSEHLAIDWTIDT